MGRGHDGVPTEDGEIWAHGDRVAETDQDVIVADELEAPNAPRFRRMMTQSVVTIDLTQIPRPARP